MPQKLFSEQASRGESNFLMALQHEQAVREAATICPHPCKLTFDLESGVRVTCDLGYLCANFSIPRPLCSQLRPDICDMTSDAHHRLQTPIP